MPMPKFPGHDKQRLEKIDHARLDFNKMDTYKPGKILGQGSFGKVYEAMNMATGEMVAIKRIELRAGNAGRMQQIVDAADQEIGMMRILRHPNVVSIMGCWMEEKGEHPAIYIVMQLVPGRSIADLIKTIGPFHELVVRRFTKQLLQALEYCHSNRAVHRDIKGQNILLTTTGEVRLADFGSAKIREESIDKDAVSGTYSYTPLWVAPETLNAKQYDEKVDIWALGCVVIEMASGKEPWDEMKFTNSYQAILHIGNSKEIPRIPSSLSDAGKEFCRMCLTRDPDRRPSARELLKHRFIVGDDGTAGPLSDEFGTRSLSADEQLRELAGLVDSKMATLELDAPRAASPVMPLRDVRPAKKAAGGNGVPPPPPPPPPAQDDDIPPPPPADAEGGPAHQYNGAAYPYKGPASADAMVPGSSVFSSAHVAAGYDNAASNRFNVVYSFGTNAGGGAGAGGGARDGGLSASSGLDGSGSGSRVFHFSPGAAGDSDSDHSPGGQNSLNSSVVSFIEGYAALRLQPDQRAPAHRR